MTGRLACLGVVAVCAATASPAGAVQLVTVADRLSLPTYVTGAPGDDTRLYVTEKNGRIKIVRDGVVQRDLFLDIGPEIDAVGEGGLLSMAFPPDHRATGLFYVFVTVRPSEGESGNDIVIQERRLDACSPDRADPAYVREVIRVEHRQLDNHNGGQLQWGPDDNLWFSVGDGGGSYDPQNDAQRLDNGMGKIHRVTPVPGGGHTIPADNPFAGSSIWAYGLRNPWRFSFDRANGDLWIGDVGQGGIQPGTGAAFDNIEEIDVARAGDGRLAGANFGWRRYEGDRENQPSAAPLAGYVPPAIALDGTDGWNSVTGGYVVRDTALEWAGDYVFGDFGSGALSRVASGAPSSVEATTLTVPQLASFGEDWSGRLYAVSFGGSVSRFVSDTGDNGPVRPAPPTGTCGEEPDETAAADETAGNPGVEPRPGDAIETLRAAGPVSFDPPAIPDLRSLPTLAPAGLGDRSGLALSSRIPRRQRLRRRALLVRAACDEPCTLTAAGKAGRRTIRPVQRRLARGVRASLRVRLGPLALAALRRTRTASIVLTATDDAGNVTRRNARVTVVR